MGERSAVLQAVNSLRKNEENNFIQEDEICMKGVFPIFAEPTLVLLVIVFQLDEQHHLTRNL